MRHLYREIHAPHASVFRLTTACFRPHLKRIGAFLGVCALLEACQLMVPYIEGRLVRAFSEGNLHHFYVAGLIAVALGGWLLSRSVLPPIAKYAEDQFRFSALRHLIPQLAHRLAGPEGMIAKGDLTPTDLGARALRLEAMIEFMALLIRVLPQIVGGAVTLGIIFFMEPIMGTVVVALALPSVIVAWIGMRRVAPRYHEQERSNIAARGKVSELFLVATEGKRSEYHAILRESIALYREYRVRGLHATVLAQWFDFLRVMFAVFANTGVWAVGYYAVVIAETLPLEVFLMLASWMLRINDLTTTVVGLVQNWLLTRPVLKLYLDSFSEASASEELDMGRGSQEEVRELVYANDNRPSGRIDEPAARFEWVLPGLPGLRERYNTMHP